MSKRIRLSGNKLEQERTPWNACRRKSNRYDVAGRMTASDATHISPKNTCNNRYESLSLLITAVRATEKWN